MLFFCRRLDFVSSLAALTALLLALPVVVSAQASDEPTPETSDEPAASGDEEARTHFESARLYFERGEYERALSDFEAAYELSGRAGLLYNIYLTLERLGRYGEAADRLEQFLGDEEAAVVADRRSDLEARLANLRARQQTREPEPAPPDEGASGGIGGLGIAGAVALGVGGASLLTFGITGGLALDEDASLASRCGRDAGRTCSEQDVSTLRTLTTTADVTLTIGLVLAAAGATMLAIDLVAGDDESERTVTLAPMLGPTVAGITVGGSR